MSPIWVIQGSRYGADGKSLRTLVVRASRLHPGKVRRVTCTTKRVRSSDSLPTPTRPLGVDPPAPLRLGVAEADDGRASDHELGLFVAAGDQAAHRRRSWCGSEPRADPVHEREGWYGCRSGNPDPAG